MTFDPDDVCQRLLAQARDADQQGWPVVWDAAPSWEQLAQQAIDREADDHDFLTPVFQAIDHARHLACAHDDVQHEEFGGVDHASQDPGTGEWTVTHQPGRPMVYCNGCYYSRVEDEPWLSPEQMFGPVDY